jgi:hypothetical protein
MIRKFVLSAGRKIRKLARAGGLQSKNLFGKRKPDESEAASEAPPEAPEQAVDAVVLPAGLEEQPEKRRGPAGVARPPSRKKAPGPLISLK